MCDPACEPWLGLEPACEPCVRFWHACRILCFGLRVGLVSRVLVRTRPRTSRCPLGPPAFSLARSGLFRFSFADSTIHSACPFERSLEIIVVGRPLGLSPRIVPPDRSSDCSLGPTLRIVPSVHVSCLRALSLVISISEQSSDLYRLRSS
jgi:hypothetical protein